MESKNGLDLAPLIEGLQQLEYDIRKSITVREDQEDNAELAQMEEAKRYGLPVTGSDTKADLLNIVQTALRAAQAKAGKGKSG